MGLFYNEKSSWLKIKPVITDTETKWFILFAGITTICRSSMIMFLIKLWKDQKTQCR